MTKRLAVIGAAVMTTLLALVVLWQFRMVVVYALLALTLAAALRPLMQRLVGRGWVAHTAWLLLYLVALGGFVFLLSRTLGAVSDEIQLMAQTVSAQDKWRLPAWLEGTPFQHALVARLPPQSAPRGGHRQRRAARLADHPRLHAGAGRRRQRRVHRSVPEHLLGRRPGSF